MQTSEEINWQSEKEVIARMEQQAKPVILLYSADWCKGCVSLKQTLNKAKELNIEYKFLDFLSDIDTLDDLNNYKYLID